MIFGNDYAIWGFVQFWQISTKRTCKEEFSQLRCEKGLATKTRRHEVEKMQSIFPLCLGDFVAIKKAA